jgi:hypothetical protein
MIMILFTNFSMKLFIYLKLVYLFWEDFYLFKINKKNVLECPFF